jgi:C4-dicarboxylate-binding protein DctP
MLTQAMYQVQPHATLSYHGYLGYAVIVNGAFWQALPETVREGLSRALDEATAYGNGIAAAKNAEALDEIVTAGTTEIHELTSDERAAWIAALLPVHEQMRDWIGADLVDEAHALLDGTTGPPT